MLLVIVDHVEGFRFDFGLSSFWGNPAVPMLGQLGVTLFFVLSGFLITYLLLEEKEKLGEIKFGAFYLRRVLRIWPLYYVVVILGLFVFPHLDFFFFPHQTPLVSQSLGMKTALYAFILPNVAKELYPAVPYLSQAWSIGVEEQFYIIWPVLVHFSRSYLRNFVLLAGGVFVVAQLSWALTTPQRHILPINEVTDFIKNFLFFFRIQCMAIGGIFALVLLRNWTGILSVLTSRLVQAAAWTLTLALIVRGQTIPYATHEMYSVLFGVLVLNLAQTDTSVVSLRHKWLDYLGRISYGLYMLHGIAVVVGIRVASLLVADASPAHHLLTFLVAVVVSILLAALSYHYLETPFLTIKKRFARIQSGS
ncbi:acyltransferase [Hymenobacter saemangeumensis]|uniref:Acyltransferase n=1 Tax=Hymenobacter saemangeumensis TaxID=1084522 RepID=A0ABP8INV0_9BACT